MHVHFTEGEKAWLKKQKNRLQHLQRLVCNVCFSPFEKKLCTFEKNTHPHLQNLSRAIATCYNTKQHQLLFCGAVATSA
jgi:hypothetical protein